MPVNFPVAEVKPLNCLSTLQTIPEAISADPSCSNLHDLSKENSVDQEPQPWSIYENDQENSKSTDALLEDSVGERQEEANFPTSLSFSIIRENQFRSNPNSSRASLETVEKPAAVRRSSGSKNTSKAYEPVSNESLTDSQGYMDDFDESCALITNDNGKQKRVLSSNDIIMKRNSLGVNKAPQIHRFSAGDADKLERGIKALPSTRSLRDSWINAISHGSGGKYVSLLHYTIFRTYQTNISNNSDFSVFQTPNVYHF